MAQALTYIQPRKNGSPPYVRPGWNGSASYVQLGRNGSASMFNRPLIRPPSRHDDLPICTNQHQDSVLMIIQNQPDTNANSPRQLGRITHLFQSFLESAQIDQTDYLVLQSFLGGLVHRQNWKNTGRNCTSAIGICALLMIDSEWMNIDITWSKHSFKNI